MSTEVRTKEDLVGRFPLPRSSEKVQWTFGSSYLKPDGITKRFIPIQIPLPTKGVQIQDYCAELENLGFNPWHVLLSGGVILSCRSVANKVRSENVPAAAVEDKLSSSFFWQQEYRRKRWTRL